MYKCKGERKRSDSQLKQTNKQNNKNKNDQKQQQQLLAKQTLTKAHLPDHTFTKAI